MARRLSEHDIGAFDNRSQRGIGVVCDCVGGNGYMVRCIGNALGHSLCTDHGNSHLISEGTRTSCESAGRICMFSNNESFHGFILSRVSRFYAQRQAPPFPAKTRADSIRS